MRWTEYVTQSMRTLNPALKTADQVANAAMGLAGETGEVCDLYKKRWFHAKDVGPKLIDELGDLYWYLALFHHFAKPEVDFLEVPTFDPLGGTGEGRRRVEALLAELLYQSATFMLTTGIHHKTRSAVVMAGCLRALCDVEGLDPREVLGRNLDKLRARWPDGFKAGVR